MNSRSILLLLLSPLIAGSALAQEVSPELKQIKEPYERSSEAIRISKDNRINPLTVNYIAALDRIAGAIGADPLIVAAARAERDRVSGSRPTTDADRKAMPVPLATLRATYDRDVARTNSALVQQETQLSKQYLASLGTLARRLTSLNQVAKAAGVQAEVDRVNQLMRRAEAVPDEGKKKKGNADSTITAGAAKALGVLNPTLAAKIKASVTAKNFTRTANSHLHETGKGWADTKDGNGLLVGFEFFAPYSDGGIRSGRPYFLTSEGLVAGSNRGAMDTIHGKLIARPGYAVAGMLISKEKEIQLIFMKIDPASGRFLTDPANTYKSPAFGRKSKEKPMLLGGDGRFVVGVYGESGADLDSLGLILLNP